MGGGSGTATVTTISGGGAQYVGSGVRGTMGRRPAPRSAMAARNMSADGSGSGIRHEHGDPEQRRGRNTWASAREAWDRRRARPFTTTGTRASAFPERARNGDGHDDFEAAACRMSAPMAASGNGEWRDDQRRRQSVRWRLTQGTGTAISTTIDSGGTQYVGNSKEAGRQPAPR